MEILKDHVFFVCRDLLRTRHASYQVEIDIRYLEMDYLEAMKNQSKQ